PQSDDVLETGMVFNIEPAIYREGFGGVRQCEMVAVTDSGADLLTPFHSKFEELLIPEKQKRATRLKRAS
ncbi:MAG TPA: M24 family metallopeptidase, partial [Terriglobales bacterium]|nr:M24 family metallopeptidase [Terriglobales bacterium]